MLATPWPEFSPSRVLLDLKQATMELTDLVYPVWFLRLGWENAVFC